MTAMTMNKAIHQAFRRDLNRLVQATASFTDGDVHRAAALGRAWQNLAHQLDRHHHGEHAYAWPAMSALGLDDDLLATLDDEHEAMAQALRVTGLVADRFRRSASRMDAEEFNLALVELHRVTVDHLTHEEAVSEQLMLDNANHPAVKQMGRQFGKVSPTEGGRFFAWVLDGAGPDEEAAIRRDVPAPVLLLIGGIFGTGYRWRIAPTWWH